ncbi:hypothetical protein DSO57_1033627 [Entomophthora muscae]|uniref:Uncharacterized protein n=1 Tax=Entomophthora muscae TaxID=34485 RepID=A0ACC2TY37_9FUNG|nr:hypothetical protein DSO57_1033627 [Entomophthora muscae]
MVVDAAYEKTLRLRVKELLNCSHENFPGALPVPLDTTRLSLLEQEDYFVCEKSDGVRYLMLSVHTSNGPATFLIDRNNSYHYIESLFLPDKDNHNKFHHETLLDGELVINKDKETNQKTLLFLVFDLMVFNSGSITQRPFSSRLGLLRQEIIEPFELYLKSKPDIAKRLPFSIVLKRVERSYGLKLVLSTLPLLEHDSDGLIFTPVFFPYKSGTCSKLLKWKPPELNTVDLRIHMTLNADRKPVYQLQAASGTALKIISPLQLSQEQYAKWRSAPPEGKIGEFRWDPDWPVTTTEKGYAPQTSRGGWVFLRMRPDKKAPNDEATAKKAIRAIEEGVTREMLEVFSDGIRTHWKERERQNDAQSMPPKTEESKPAEECNKAPDTSQELDDSAMPAPPSADSSHQEQDAPASTEEPPLPPNGADKSLEPLEPVLAESSEKPQVNGDSAIPSETIEADHHSGPPAEPSQDPPEDEGLPLRPAASRIIDEEKRASSMPSSETPLRVARRQHSDSNINVESLKPLCLASPSNDPKVSPPDLAGHSSKKSRLNQNPSIDEHVESASPLPAPHSSEVPSEAPMEIDPSPAPKKTSSLFALMSPEPSMQEPALEPMADEPAPELTQSAPLFVRPNDPRLSSDTKSNSSSTGNSAPPTEPIARRKSKSHKTSRLAHLLNGNPADSSSGDPSNMTPPALVPSPPPLRLSPPPMRLSPPQIRPSPPPVTQARQPFEPHFRPPYYTTAANAHPRGEPLYNYSEMHSGQPRFMPNPQSIPQGLPQGHPQGHPQSMPTYPPPGTLSGPQAGAYLFGSMAPGARPHPVLTPQQLSNRDANMRRGSFGMPYYKPYPEPNMPPEHGRLPMSSGLSHGGSLRRSSLSQAAWANGRPEPYPQHMQPHSGHGPKYPMGSYPGRPMQQNVSIMHRPIAAHPNPNPPPNMRPRPFSGPPPLGYSQSYPLLTSTQGFPIGHQPQAYPQGYPGNYSQGHHQQNQSFQPHSNQSMHHPHQFQSPQSLSQSLNLQQHPSPRPGSGPGQVAASTTSTPPLASQRGCWISS